MIFAPVLPQPCRIFKHWKPPFIQNSLYCAAEIPGIDRVDQRLWVWTGKNDSLLADNMPLNDPITAAFIQVEPAFIDGGAGTTARVMLPDIPSGNIGTFQFGCPFQATVPDAVVHGFQVSDGLVRQGAGGHDKKINIT